MFIPIVSVRYRRRRQVLFFIIFSLFSLLFVRGLELHLKTTNIDRMRVHAIPTAMSVLYHNHPHDYTGLRAIAMPFQGPGSLKGLVHEARTKDLGGDKSVYYWVADDKGMEDYVIAAFYLFGPHVDSLYYMWFLVLLASISFFLISFGRQMGALGFLCLTLLGIHIAVSTLPYCNLSAAYLHAPPLPIYEARCLDILALPAIIHILFLAAKRGRFRWLRDILPLMGQLFIFLSLYHSRSSLAWEIVAVFLFCSFLVATRLYKNRQTANNNLSKSKAGIRAPILVASILALSLVSLNLYKHITYNHRYFSDMGSRTIWHNALMGFQYDDEISKKYNVAIGDLQIAQAVINYANTTGRCEPDVGQFQPQQLLDTLGDHGEANWTHYERCAKSLYMAILSNNKLEAAKLFLIKKPHIAFSNLNVWSHDIGEAGADREIKEWRLGWHPFGVINLAFFLFVFIISYKAIYRSRAKLIPLILIVLACSLIPAVIFYEVVLIQGGMMVISAVAVYLALILLLKPILGFVNKAGNNFETSPFPTPTKKLSVLIPGYNEEKCIALTMREVHEAAVRTLDDFEIIVIDDGSQDATYSEALAEAEKLGPKVRVLLQKPNKGVGQAFHLGLAEAKFPQLCLVPGDNAFNKEGVELIFSRAGVTPLVISYRQNMGVRTPLRYVLSRVLTLFLGVITGLKVRDAHSLYLFPVVETRSLGVKAAGYGYHMEILSRLLTRLNAYSEVAVDLNPRPDASSGVMKPKTLLIFGATLGKLFWLRLIGRL